MEKIINQKTKELSFPELPFAYNALEPYIDRMTMEIHHSKHHKAYYDNFLKAVTGTEIENISLKEIFKIAGKVPVALRNNGGGYFNHLLFWQNLSSVSTQPTGKLLDEILKTWKTLDAFKAEFSNAAATRFGSGWAWLNLGNDDELFISSTPNQDNPLMDVAEKKGIPLLCLDVWEHAYYLKYQNRRPEYIQNFWNVVNWDAVTKRYEEALVK
jgi:superoxide dismutase, Fe-Mn family